MNSGNVLHYEAKQICALSPDGTGLLEYQSSGVQVVNFEFELLR